MRWKAISHYLYLIPVLLFLLALVLAPIASGVLLIDGIAHGMRSSLHAIAFWLLYLFAVCAYYLGPVFDNSGASHYGR